MISETNHPTTPRTPGVLGADADVVAGLRRWLIDRVAYYTEREPGDIDADAPVASYGLDSVYAFALCGDIEDEFKLLIEPTLVWDFGTVTALAAKLASDLP